MVQSWWDKAADEAAREDTPAPKGQWYTPTPDGVGLTILSVGQYNIPVPKRNRPQDHPELLGLPEVRKLWQTEGLFSDHYLKAHLRKNDWWPGDPEARGVWEFCQLIYEKRYLACARNNEAFTRQELIDKILEKLDSPCASSSSARSTRACLNTTSSLRKAGSR